VGLVLTLIAAGVCVILIQLERAGWRPRRPDSHAGQPPAVVAGDPTWTPPMYRVDSRGRPAHGEVGSRWRLTHRASIVIPEHHDDMMFELLDPAAVADRYTLEAGTHLRLERIHNPDDDPRAGDLDMVSYIQYAEGWDSWTMRIEDGPSAGVVLTVPTRLEAWSRFPSDIRRSSLALVRVAEDSDNLSGAPADAAFAGEPDPPVLDVEGGPLLRGRRA
jgi:hypothetical protein